MGNKKIQVNADLCTGCRMCEQVCSLKYTEGEINPKKSCIRVKMNPIIAYDEPTVCSQCEGQFCMEACPVEAIEMNEATGVLEVNLDQCTGCRLCVSACPENAMFMDEEARKAQKCNLCGGDPKCVKICSLKAISF